MRPYILRADVAAGFLALVVAFHFVQPYRLIFFSHTQLVQIAYSFGRLVFCAYYFAILFSIGNLLLSLVFRRATPLTLRPLEEIGISVICGSAVLRLGMLRRVSQERRIRDTLCRFSGALPASGEHLRQVERSPAMADKARRDPAARGRLAMKPMPTWAREAGAETTSELSLLRDNLEECTTEMPLRR